ncbi:MAG: (2Fe-2S)-binding protein [Deltaproteobacteria bacterium]|nr:(2Fe-2S)-binding protein [Deltaproteobacteria bacterium]
MDGSEEAIHFVLNGRPVTAEVDPSRTLLWLLRERFDLTGAKEGCGVGECGACTVLLDGEAVNACLLLAGKVQGRSVTTVEGLGGPEALHPLQKAFLEKHAVQCGFCTPGMLLSAKALLDRTPRPTREEIRTALSGNLCRCTGYTQIVEAVFTASRREAP